MKAARIIAGPTGGRGKPRVIRAVNGEKCATPKCRRKGTCTVKIYLFADGYIEPVQIYMKLPLCEKHKIPDEEITALIKLNWEKIATGFEQMGQPRPVLDATLFKWVTWMEAVEFWTQHEAANPVVIRTQ